MTAFALAFAHPQTHRPGTYTYDAHLQLNVTPIGTPAVRAGGAEMGTATSSTAGSKTHSDDTDS